MQNLTYGSVNFFIYPLTFAFFGYKIYIPYWGMQKNSNYPTTKGTNMENCNKTCSCCERTKNTPRSEEELKALNDRLNRIIGQLGGIKNMINENRYCGDVLIQLSAAENALQNLGYMIFKNHLETCVVESIKEGNSEILAEVIELMKKLK